MQDLTSLAASRVGMGSEDDWWDAVYADPRRLRAASARSARAPRSAAAALYVHDARRLYRLTAPGEIFFELTYPTVDRFTMPGGIEELELHAHTAASADWWQRIAWTATSPGASHVGMAR